LDRRSVVGPDLLHPHQRCSWSSGTAGLRRLDKRLESGKFRWPGVEDGIGSAMGNSVGSAEGLLRGACLHRKLFSSLAVKCIERQFGTG
jgi:hypothetical protein